MLLFNGLSSLTNIKHLCFNTSYVTVQRKDFTEAQVYWKFQYILCYCSTCRSVRICKREKNVSIHPMLLFNVEQNWIGGMWEQFQYILCYCSTKKEYKEIWLNPRFQYILCYCSTFTIDTFKCSFKSFNTSYVTVQPTYLSRFYFLSYHKPLIFQYFLKFFPGNWYTFNKSI